MTETLAGYYDVLTKRDRRVLVAALNYPSSNEDTKYHLGNLWLVPVQVALQALILQRQWMVKDQLGHPVNLIYNKLKRANQTDKEASFIIYLNDKKVAKKIGAHPERGFALKGITKRVTVGVKWSLPKRDHIPDDNVLVNPVVTLNALGRGKWRVTVEKQYRQAAERYLMDNLI